MGVKVRLLCDQNYDGWPYRAKAIIEVTPEAAEAMVSEGKAEYRDGKSDGGVKLQVDSVVSVGGPDSA